MPRARGFERKKVPRQERSKATVEYILSAAAELLGHDGLQRVTTNRIAQRAGVAVASLYQYFPNKEAIVGALFEHELSLERAEFTRTSKDLDGAPLREGIAAAVRAVIHVHAKRPNLVRSLLEAVPLLGGATAQAMARREVTELVLATMRRRATELRSADNLDKKAFLVVHAVEAAIHDAAREHPDYLDDPAFAEELTALVERYLLA
jgi:AcrR family transcriptional regulator